MGYPIVQGNTTEPLTFRMLSAADHITPMAGLAPVVHLSKNGFPFAYPAGAVTEVGLGLYRVEPNAADADTVGTLELHAAAPGADTVLDTFEVTPPPAPPPEPVPGEGITLTAIGLITRAMQTCGKHSPGEDPAGELVEQGFEVLNEMLDHWRTQKLLIPQLKRIEFDLPSGSQVEFTVGPGGDIDIPTPFGLKYAFLQSPTGTAGERPIDVLTDESLAQRSYKVVTGAAITEVYYEASYPLGKLSVPAASAGGRLVLYVLTGLPSFATLTQPYIFLPGYAKALRYGLTLQLAAIYGVTLSNFILGEAGTSIADVKRMNWRPSLLTNYFSGGGGRYNIYRDQ